MGLFKLIKESFDSALDDVKKDLDETKQQLCDAVGIKNNQKSDAKKAVQKPLHESASKPASKAKSVNFDWNQLLNCTSIEIPEGVTEIPKDLKFNYKNSYGGRLMDALENLTSIVFPSTLVRIGEMAFHNCPRLSSIDFSKCLNLEIIEQQAFDMCPLVDVDFSNCTSLVTIGSGTFSDCKLEKVDLTRCTNLKEIGSYAFNNNNLSEIIIPDSVVHIGEKAFSGNNLSGIVIPDSVERVGREAFSYNENLVKYTIGVSAKWPAQKNSSDSPFYELPNLKEIIFRSMVVEALGTYDMKKLKKVVLADTVKEIGDNAFRYFNSIAEISIPDSVTVIGNDAFANTNIRELVLPSELMEIGRIGRMEKIRRLDFSKVSKLEVIPEEFLSWNSTLTDLVLPIGLRKIEEKLIGGSFPIRAPFNRLFLPPTIEVVEDLNGANLEIYCFSPHIDELGSMVNTIVNHKFSSFQNHLFVLPEYLDSYKAQLKAEGVSEIFLSIDVIPEELRYYYDN